ncbi:MAG: DUF421 domain-containing protein [Clostridia bacterium]
MGISFLRTIILYLFISIGLRVMGKRQVGEMQPTEFVITILISELISIPMQDVSIPLFNGIIPILVLIALELLTSFFMMKSNRFRHLFIGRSSILIERGKVNQKELDKTRCNIAELLEELRLKGATCIEEVEFAILETNGKISVILKGSLSPVTQGQLEISPEKKQIPISIIVNGVLDKKNIKNGNVSIERVNEILKKNRLSDIKKVFLLCVYPDGSDFLIKKEKVN